MSAMTDVAIIGAGPYGLSVAANLRAAGVDHRIVGKPMDTWLAHMPKGMQLKSDGFASDLDDPRGELTLKKFCAERAIKYADAGIPVHIDTFTAYGLEFQKRFAPGLEDKMLAQLERTNNGFLVRLDDGETFTARRVVLALGISYFRNLPSQLAHLPPAYISHASDICDLAPFKDRDITVIGGGSSAIDLAGLLHEAGARVRVIARRKELEIHPAPKYRPIWAKVRHPMSYLGPSWENVFFSYAPLAFHFLPEATRLRLVKSKLGPAAGYFMRGRVIGKVETVMDSQARHAEIVDGKVRLSIENKAGRRHEAMTEHVITATGYKVDLDQYRFLSDSLRAQIATVERTPTLSSYFESSVPGLYFIGPSAANSFGPVMRFAAGSRFAARRTSAHLARARAAAPRAVESGGALTAAQGRTAL